MTREKMIELAKAYIAAEVVFADHSKARGIDESVQIMISREEYQNIYLPILRELYQKENRNKTQKIIESIDNQ